MTTAADYRKEAWECRLRNDYRTAANMYEKAIELYPAHATGALADLDRDTLESNLWLCNDVLARDAK